MAPEVALLAFAVEAAVGYPAKLHARLPHPVVWLGRAISALEKHWNQPGFPDARRRALGVATVGVVAGGAAGVGYVLQAPFAPFWWGVLPLAILGSVGLASRSLCDHVRAVRDALEADDLAAARAAVGLIVGRDTADLDAPGVAAAGLESLAESFNDGVVAPLFWLALGGLPGLFAYKAVNTADSMIGHMEPRWRMFGWAAARTDDLMNWIPARIAGVLIALAARRGFRVMWRDARRHASPNAGWPEAAMAGGLGRTLGGAASYDGATMARPTFGDGPAPGAADLRRGLKIYVLACFALAGMLIPLIAVSSWLR